MNPRVSVVMPSYNHAEFVGEGIRSVLEQSFGDLELVVTDDGSTDATANVIRSIADPRLKFVASPSNRGGVLTGNSCIARSSGEYVARLNSDDYFLPGKLQAQVEFLDANPDMAAVFGLPRLIDERGNALPGGYAEFSYPFAHPRPTRLEWLRLLFFHGNGFCFPTVMIRRSALDEVGLLDPRFASLPDFDLWVRLCMKHNVFVMQKELIAFRKLDNNRNVSAPRRDTKLRSQFEYFQVLKHYRQMEPVTARKIFADDLKRLGIDADQPLDLWLGQLALSAPSTPHNLFGLDTMFEGAGEIDDPRRLTRLTGQVDALNVGLAEDLRAMLLARQPGFQPVRR